MSNMIEKLKNQILNWVYHHELFYFFVKSIVRTIRRDRNYIRKHLHMDVNPDLLEISHLGENYKGTIVYSIRERGNGYGFFAEFKVLLEELLYADRLGLKPYINFGKNFLYYEKNGVNGEKNAFQYYFQPVSEVQKVEECFNVLFAKDCHINYIEKAYGVKGYKVPESLQNELARMICKYVSLKPELKEEFDKRFADMFPEGKILGIHYRGTDFKEGYNIHPVSVQIEQIVSVVKKACSQNSFTRIFLATDERGIFEVLKREFGDCVKQYSDVFRSDSKVSVAFSKSNRENHHYCLGFEVLRDAYTLSRCNGLVAGLSQVSFSAQLLKKSRNESYEFIKIIDNGINKSEKIFAVKDVLK